MRGLLRAIAGPAFIALLGVGVFSAEAGATGTKDGDQRVRISLKNGAIFDGIVRQGVLYERLKKGWFQTVEEREARRDDGVRIWYPGFAQGFVFLRKGDIRKIEKLSRLQSKEAQEIQEIVSNKAKRALEVYEEVLRAREENLAAKNPPADLVARADVSDQEDWIAPARPIGVYPVLDRFPPEDGWSERKAQKIERRKWLIGVFPDSNEKAFLSVLPRWKEQKVTWDNQAILIAQQQKKEALNSPGTANAKTAFVPTKMVDNSPVEPSVTPAQAAPEKSQASLFSPSTTVSQPSPSFPAKSAGAGSGFVGDTKGTRGSVVPKTPKKSGATKSPAVVPTTPKKSSTGKDPE